VPTRAVLAAAVLAVVGIVLAAVLWPGGLIDLDVYRVGARALCAGRPLYEARAPRTGLPFTYPPLAAALFTPLAYLPAAVAKAVWTLVELAALLGLAAEARRLAGHRVAGHRRAGDRPAGDRLAGARPAALVTAALFLAALPLEPVRSNLCLGQVNIVLALAVVRDLTGRSGRLPAGLLTGIAAAVKLTPLIFLVQLALCRRPRTAAVGLAGFLTTTGAAALLAPRDTWVFFSGRGFDASRVGGVGFLGNQSLYGTLVRLAHGPAGVQDVYRPLALAVALAGLLLARQVALGPKAERTSYERTSYERTNCGRADGERADGERADGEGAGPGRPFAGFAICAVTGLLVSPISWSHHWIWIVVVLPWLAWGADAPRWGRRAAAAGWVFFAAAPIWWVPPGPPGASAGLSEHGWQLVAVNSYVIAAVLFVAGLVIWPAVGARIPERPGTVASAM